MQNNEWLFISYMKLRTCHTQHSAIANPIIFDDINFFQGGECCGGSLLLETRIVGFTLEAMNGTILSAQHLLSPLSNLAPAHPLIFADIHFSQGGESCGRSLHLETWYNHP